MPTDSIWSLIYHVMNLNIVYRGPIKTIATLFLTTALAFLVHFYIFCTTGNRNEYSTKNLQNEYLITMSPLSVKTKNNTKTAKQKQPCSPFCASVVQCSSFPVC